MRATIVLVLFAAVGASSTNNAQQSKGAAIAKVVEMLTDMLAKGKAEKQAETVRFAAFKQFCESTAGEKGRAIKSSKEAIDQLEAEIAKAASDVQEITKYVAGLDSDVANWHDDLKRTTAERAESHAAYKVAHADYTESIDAVARALKVLEKGPGGKEVAQALLQKPSSMFALLQLPEEKMPGHLRQAIMSFIQKIDPAKALLQEAEDEGVVMPAGAPAAAAFEGSSGGVIDMIERLGDKFDDEKQALEKKEANELSAFALMRSDLTSQISAAGEERSTKESNKNSRAEDEAEAKGDLADTSAALAADEKFLADLNAECSQKSYDYQQRQVVRQGEIEAITKAIEIMSSDSVAGAGDKHGVGLVQKVSKVSLAQLRSSVASPAQEAVANFLQQKAGETNSRLLALVAAKAASDPFTKVKKLIQDMITKLNEEANADATHEAFCDTEMGTNKQTRDKKTAESENLEADIEELTADIAKLGSEISDLGNQVAEIDASVQKATADRNDEKAKNQETLSDATNGATAVARAIAVLKEFYEKAAVPVEQPAPQQGPIAYDNRALQILKNSQGGAVLLQTGAVASKGKVPGAPEMEEGAYTGMGNGGVLGLMEVCQSDFEKLAAETEATEAEAAKEYEKFMADASQDKAVKLTDQTHKTNARQGKISSLATAKKDLRITQDELAAAMAYYEKLKPDCEAKVLSYAEKKAAREAEIESLKEALTILAGDSV